MMIIERRIFALIFSHGDAKDSVASAQFIYHFHALGDFSQNGVTSPES